MQKKDRIYLKNLINKFSKNIVLNQKKYPLLKNAFSSEDILCGAKVLLSQKITMAEITKKFEYEFAKYIGTKYALMVNSGSSANLLASFALVNPQKKNYLKQGDECIIQALCWSTSLWPIVQAGLIPKFIDVDLNSFNLNIKSLEEKITKKTKAIMAVHVLGNSSNIEKISNIAKKNNIFLIEDTCESLGSKYGSKFLGTFGDFGTYSFYYSHQITSGEGGMIVCNSKEDYQLIYSMRSHGWDRGLNDNSKKKILPSFNFINSGFNLRPLDITAAIGFSQFKRINSMIKIRSENRTKIINKLTTSPLWKNQFTFLYNSKKVKPSWFGLPILINKKYMYKKKKFLDFINKKGIETRMILSGNFMNQSSIKLYNFKEKNILYNNAQEIENRGFFIGLHTELINEQLLNYLEKNLLMIEKI